MLFQSFMASLSQSPFTLWNERYNERWVRLSAWVSQCAWCMCFREGHGSWASEDPVSTEERKESSWEEERSRSGSEDCSQSSAGPHMSCLQGEKLMWLKLWPKGHWFELVLWGITVPQTSYLIKKRCYSLYRHRCQTPRPLNSILKANTQNLLCLLSWWMFKLKGCKETNMNLKQGWV